MAGASLLALLDDITSVLDDVALLTKAATKKTAGVLGDDIALNAQQVSGTVANRELPVVWAVAKGSFVNKLILVPLALAISAFLPVAIVPLLMVGGVYLCYEGVEKIAHSFFHRKDRAHVQPLSAESSTHPPLASGEVAIEPAPGQVTPEQAKIKGAVRTDFILSAEIVAITLGTVAAETFTVQAVVVSGVAILLTVGVYGFVAAVVKLDDAGLFLSQRRGTGFFVRLQRGVGVAILAFAPYLMKGLSVVGTAAMFLVGGSILVHGIPALEEAIHHLVQAGPGTPGFLAATLSIVGPLLAHAVVGIVAGAVALGVVKVVAQLKK